MNESRAKTAEEVRAELFSYMRRLISYWDSVEGPETTEERLDGLAFSILNIFDGTGQSLVFVDLVLRPHPDNKAFCQKEGENWYEDGQIINEGVYLHELWYEKTSNE